MNSVWVVEILGTKKEDSIQMAYTQTYFECFKVIASKMSEAIEIAKKLVGERANGDARCRVLKSYRVCDIHELINTKENEVIAEEDASLEPSSSVVEAIPLLKRNTEQELSVLAQPKYLPKGNYTFPPQAFTSSGETTISVPMMPPINKIGEERWDAALNTVLHTIEKFEGITFATVADFQKALKDIVNKMKIESSIKMPDKKPRGRPKKRQNETL
jgi:hypothetical protein